MDLRQIRDEVSALRDLSQEIARREKIDTSMLCYLLEMVEMEASERIKSSEKLLIVD